ncbi:MAG: PilZ domain-containing protein, partial [Pseudomonadales bacterium]
MPFSEQPFSEGLSYSDHLPFTVTKRSEQPPVAERVRMNERNFSLLKTHALEDFQRREIDAEFEGIASEIERIDQKMNLITELLCDLLTVEAKIPPPRPLLLSSDGVQFVPDSPLPLKPQDWALFELYLMDDVPRPLKLMVRVVDNNPEAPENAVTLSFADLSDGVQSMLGRLVFRHHRREVALARQNAADKNAREAQ